MRTPDRAFTVARLAELYDDLDPDRSDLDVYAAIVEELGATTVIDVGCGTGTFACRLAERGVDVTGVDPAAASIDVARRKPGADKVTWLVRDATMLPAVGADLAVMTGNVAQVFLTEAEWRGTLLGIRRALRPRGVLVFETRVSERRAWEEWTEERTRTITDVDGVGEVESWTRLGEVALPFVSFTSSVRFAADGVLLDSESTLRFRSRAEIAESLEACGYELREVRDAPDRPGREHVFLATAI